MLKQLKVGFTLHLIFILLYALAYALSFTSSAYYAIFYFAVPLHLLGIYHLMQKKHSILRNYPIIGYMRYLLESIRPELRQYFFESDLDGKPFNRRQRSIVYQRAKNVKQTVPFGMQANSQEIGYEWLAHSMYPVKIQAKDLRVQIGGNQCSQPYSSSILNISAMSYGSLSKTAVLAFNEGAKIGGFAQNTGEGGISPYHLEKGGDLIWQIGTGYFGCRKMDGHFDEKLFKENAAHDSIKMIEIKLSQGAKPGHGGILPAAKNTPEIAAIRNVEPHTTVASPPTHSAFSDNYTMLLFIDKLRKLSNGKPIGIKLCIGSKEEFESLVKEMRDNYIYPDYICIDGAEGGTGAAPLEFSDSLGMPLYDALSFANNTLIKYGVRDELKIIAAGKIITGVDIIKAIALGADSCYSARGMMFALGCIQALQCDSGKCPVGIATQDPSLYQAIDPTEKKHRIANFHKNTIHSTIEVMEACGMSSLKDINAKKVFRRVSNGKIESFEEIYFRKETNQFELINEN